MPQTRCLMRAGNLLKIAESQGIMTEAVYLRFHCNVCPGVFS